MEPRSQASQVRKRQRGGSPGGNTPREEDTPPSLSLQTLPKISLPRITTAKPRSRRASRACINCREQKAKCTGGVLCDRCRELNLECVFVAKKSEKIARRLQDLEVRAKEFYRLLRRLHPNVDQRDQSLIERALEQETPPSSVSSFSESSADDITHLATPLADLVDEDFNRDKTTQATGFVGPHSERSWLHQLKRNGIRYDGSYLDAETANGRIADSISSVDYFLDDQELSVDFSVPPFAFPPREVADDLLNTYFDMVHPSLPIIGKTVFLHQYRRLYTEPLSSPPRKWLAILHFMLAVAAQHSSLRSNANEIDEWHDHSRYFSRASKLGLTDNPLFPHPDIQQAQIEALAAFYLLTIGQVNRAWRMSGLAVRSAIAMGLHLRSVSKDTLDISKELRCRVWWSIYLLETTLSLITGRPYTLADRFCTAPLPLPFDEEQFRDPSVAHLLRDPIARNTFIRHLLLGRVQTSGMDFPSVTPCVSLYFLQTVEIARLKRRAIDKLYAPGRFGRKKKSAGETTDELVDCVNRWRANLPEPFQLTRSKRDSKYQRQQLCLALHFYSANITIGRIAIHRDRPSSPRLKDMANICTASALSILSQLPDEPDLDWLTQIAPWCCILHDMMQSLTVLLMELDSRTRHGAKDLGLILTSIQKGMRWLLAMGSRHAPSQRAWQICQDLYLRLNPTTTPLALRTS